MLNKWGYVWRIYIYIYEYIRIFNGECIGVLFWNMV